VLLLQAKCYTMLIILNRDVRNDNTEAVSQMAVAAVLLNNKSSRMWRYGPNVVSPFHGQENILTALRRRRGHHDLSKSSGPLVQRIRDTASWPRRLDSSPLVQGKHFPANVQQWRYCGNDDGWHHLCISNCK